MAYADSNHLFTQPVRTYKANDPYYYEVDNIPIRQLEENVLWAKDQLDSIITPSGTGVGGPLFVGDDLDLENIKQFRPKWAGGRNIKVQAGNFTGRVNDAYNIRDKLSNLVASGVQPGVPTVGQQVAGWGDNTVLPILVDNTDATFLSGVWYSYITQIGSAPAAVADLQQSYNDNGLETMFTFYISGRDGRPNIGTEENTSYRVPQYTAGSFYTDRAYTWPVMWHAAIKNFTGLLDRADPSKFNEIHMAISRFWRGVARTSVVDFREQNIEIPAFDALDYYYVEEINGIDQTFSLSDTATQRLDLLVVYTHPIDSSASYIEEYDNATPPPLATNSRSPAVPKKITGATLGIIRGAGVGVRKLADGTIELDSHRVDPGKPKILANMNDHLQGTNTGIKLKSGNILKGSFPSPDDLLNLAPNLSLGLANNNLQLIGQTVLPIAYIIVNKDQTNLIQADIIDIRPFLRTTELAYNERAGIAAAEPPLSLANPAIGAAQLEGKLSDLGLIGQFTPVGGGGSVNLGLTRTIYNDYIMGGLLWGPEGVRLMFNEAPGGPWYQSMPERAGTSPTITPGGLTGFGGLSRTNRLDYLWGLYRSQQQLAGAGGNYGGTGGITANLNLQAWLNGNYQQIPGSPTQTDRYMNCSPDRAIPFVPEWQYQYAENGTAQGLTYTPYNYQTNRNAERWVWHLKTGKRYISPGYYGGMFQCGVQEGGADGTWSGLSEGTFPGAGGGPGDYSDVGRSDMRCLVKQFYVKLPPDAEDYDVDLNYEGSIPDLYLDESYWNQLGPGGNPVGGSPAKPTFTQGDGAQLSVSKSPIMIHPTLGRIAWFTVIAKYPMHSWGSNQDAQEFMPYTVYDYFRWQPGNRACATAGAPYAYGSVDPDGIAAVPNIASGKCHYPTVRIKIQIYTQINKQIATIVAGADDNYWEGRKFGRLTPEVAEGSTQPPFSAIANNASQGQDADQGQWNLDLRSG